MRLLMRDARFALRSLLRRPVFLAVNVVSLGLGIGVCTVIFSLIDTLLLRPLDYEAPERLVMLREVPVEQPDQRLPVAPQTLEDWRRQARSFTEITAIGETNPVLTTGEGGAEQLTGAAVSANLFPTLGVSPAQGRVFTPEEARPGGGGVMIVSHEFWTRRFGGDPDLVGRTLGLDGEARTVIGIMPEGFEYLFPSLDVWTPLTIDPAELGRDSRLLAVTARLAPGVTPQEAQQEMVGISRRIAEEHPATNEGFSAQVIPLQTWFLGPNNRSILILLTAGVLLVLVIACINVAGLLVGRATSRVREMGVRIALGAGRRRLAAQLLTEGAVLGVLGSLFGTLMAAGGIRWLASALAGRAPRIGEMGFDLRVLGFAVAAGLVTSLLFSLAPALSVFRIDLRSAVAEGAHGTTTSQRLRSAFVAVQLGVAVILLVLSGLMVRSFSYMERADVGFEAGRVLTFRLPVVRPDLADDAAAAAHLQRFPERLEALPGVESASAVTTLPRSRWIPEVPVVPAGWPAPEGERSPSAAAQVVMPDYFETLGIPREAGRTFTDADRAGGPEVAVVSRSLAERLWPAASAVGQSLAVAGASREVVGVVGDVLHTRFATEQAPQPTVYLPLSQMPTRELVFVLRTSGDSLVAADPVRGAVWSVDPDQPINELRTFDQHVALEFQGPRLLIQLLGGFTFVALLLAVVGVYGVVSSAVVERLPEFGVRFALGATRGDVLRMVLRRAALLAAAGFGAGLVATVFAVRMVRGFLYGVGPADPTVMAGVVLVLTAVTLLAAYLPARSAARTDPTESLRYE